MAIKISSARVFIIAITLLNVFYLNKLTAPPVAIVADYFVDVKKGTLLNNPL